MRFDVKGWDGFFWIASVFVLTALVVGLDHYRRPPLLRGSGPERRVYFTETLRRAEELRKEGRYRVEPEAKWHLFRGWAEQLEPVEGQLTARAVRRRTQVILPAFGSTALKVRVELIPLPVTRNGPQPLRIELGANGETITEVTLQRRKVLELEIPGALVHRGDNILFLYRVRRSDESIAWVALGFIEVVALP